MAEVKNYSGKKKSKQHNHHDVHKRRPHHHHKEEHQEILMDEEETSVRASGEESDAINTEAQNEGAGLRSSSARARKHSGFTSESDDLRAKDMDYEGDTSSANHNGHDHNHDDHQEKIHLDFYGSNILREKAPKVMEIADIVADEWVHDGQFEGLPVGNPLAQLVAAKALRKVKDVEKKLDEKGVFAIVRMGVDYAKAEINKRKKS